MYIAAPSLLVAYLSVYLILTFLFHLSHVAHLSKTFRVMPWLLLSHKSGADDPPSWLYGGGSGNIWFDSFVLVLSVYVAAWASSEENFILRNQGWKGLYISRFKRRLSLFHKVDLFVPVTNMEFIPSRNGFYIGHSFAFYTVYPPSTYVFARGNGCLNSGFPSFRRTTVSG